MTPEEVQEKEYLIPYHYLDLVVDYYKDIFFYNYLSKLNLVKKHVSEKKYVLDFGCGDGRLCYELKKTNNVEGIDISKKAIGFAKIINPDVKFHNKDLYKLNTKKKYDIITSIDVLEHIPFKELPYIVEKLNSLLKKKGIIIITVPSKNMKLTKKHYQHFTEKTLENIMNKYFIKEKIIGFKKIGFKKNFYNNLIRLLLVIYPLKNMFNIVKKYIEFTKKYYDSNLSIGYPEQCEGILYIGVKK